MEKREKKKSKTCKNKDGDLNIKVILLKFSKQILTNFLKADISLASDC